MRRAVLKHLGFGLAVCAAPLVLGMVASPAHAVVPPAGFVVENAFPSATFIQPVQIVFMPDDRKLVVQQGGIVWVMTAAGVQLPTPFIDLSTKVLDLEGLGLLGVALDPDFTTNRWVYFAYTVDPDSEATDFFKEAYGRIERYQVDATDANVIDLSTRQVLIGIDWPSGIPCPDIYHTIGALRFGPDKSLLASSGEAAHFAFTDAGGQDPDQFLPGRADPSQDIGAFRSLSLNSLGGKILRLDKETGQGLPSNPYWDGNPVSPRSRVWVYGVRNPYRFVVRPGTGNTDPSAGDPGVLYIGDTGWNTYESIRVARVGGVNMGWPCREGPLSQPLYEAVTSTAYPDDNVLCSASPNPENPTAATTPLLWWHHMDGSLSYPLGWTGRSTTGGTFHQGSSYPAPFAGAYFCSDFTDGWIRYVQVNGADQVVASGDFVSDALGPVDLEWNPATGDLFYI